MAACRGTCVQFNNNYNNVFFLFFTSIIHVHTIITIIHKKGKVCSTMTIPK